VNLEDKDGGRTFENQIMIKRRTEKKQAIRKKREEENAADNKTQEGKPSG